MQRQNVRVLQTREKPNLPNEAELARIRVWIGVENFQRDLSLVAGVAREIYGRESALADLSSYLVTTRERRAESGERVMRGWGSHRTNLSADRHTSQIFPADR